MSTATLDTPASRHGPLTRLAHGALGTAVVVQLASSQFMNPDNGGNSIFEIHEYIGLIALAAVLLFWVTVMARRYGSEPAAMFPWFDVARRKALWQDTRAHVTDLVKFRLPAYAAHSPFAGAIHGLGLVIITLMAASGTLYYVVNAGDPDAGGLVAVAMNVHRAFGNLAWAYLIVHAVTAVIYHFASDMSLRDMWSLRGRGSKG